MTDKRILKTKKALKTTLIDMMKQQAFQKIKVKDLCDRANTSKLTFYTHYDDKYALLQDVVSDMENEVMAKFLELQEEDPAENNLIKHNHHMLQAILFVENNYSQIFETAKRECNYSFLMYFYEYLIDSFSDTERFLTDTVKTTYPITELVAFLITGIWGYSYAAEKKELPRKELEMQLYNLIDDISNSNLFVR